MQFEKKLPRYVGIGGRIHGVEIVAFALRVSAFADNAGAHFGSVRFSEELFSFLLLRVRTNIGSTSFNVFRTHDEV